MSISDFKPRIKRRPWLWIGSGLLLALIAMVLLGSRSRVGRALVKTYLPALAPSAVVAAVEAVPPLPQSVFDCEPTPIAWIEPGTEVLDGPPQGWSHLVIKNDMQVTAGRLTEDAAVWNRMATLFSLAVLADVQRDPAQGNYYLARLAMGWCQPIDGHPRVISTATYQKLGAKLDPLEAVSLAMREVDCDDNTRVVARAAASLFYDVHRVLAYGERHLSGRLRHALLVYPRTGELAALMWIVPPAEIGPPEEGFLERLPASMVTTFELQFLPSQGNLLSMPSPDDFAVRGVPQGQTRIRVTPELARLVYREEFDGAAAVALERALRAELGWN